MDLEIQFAKPVLITTGDMNYYDTLVSVCACNRMKFAKLPAKIANNVVFESDSLKKYTQTG